MLYRFRPLRGLHCNPAARHVPTGARVQTEPSGFGKAGTLSVPSSLRRGQRNPGANQLGTAMKSFGSNNILAASTGERGLR
jgi:hypothetical protein